MYNYHSSDIVWCENKYVVSRYIVEFMNTISNLPVLYLALTSLLPAFSVLSVSNNGKKISVHSILLRLVFVTIPIFSLYFHATLSYAGQCLDELAILVFVILLENNLTHMLIEMCLSLICLFIYPSINRFLLVCYGFISCYKYHYSDVDPVLCRRIIFLLGSGFILWSVDILFCDYLVISLHWIWHLLSGLAGYYAIQLVL